VRYCSITELAPLSDEDEDEGQSAWLWRNGSAEAGCPKYSLDKRLPLMIEWLRHTGCMEMSGMPFPSKLPPHIGDLNPHTDTWFLGSIRLRIPNGISIGSAKKHSSRQTVPNTWQWAPWPKKLPFPMGDLDPYLIGPYIVPWADLESSIQTSSRSVQLLCNVHGKAFLYFTMERPFPKNCPFAWGSRPPPSNRWFLGPTRVLNPNGISIGSVIFARLTTVADQQTDHAILGLYNNRPHLRT